MSPIRLDRVQRGIYEALQTALGAPPAGALVAWAYGEQPYAAGPDAGLVSLTMVGGPSPGLLQSKRAVTQKAYTSADVQVAAASESRYTVEANGVPYFYDATGADTVTTIRDALIALVEADTLAAVSASIVSADTLRISADTTGSLWRLRLSGALDFGNLVDSGAFVSITEGNMVASIGVQAFSKTREPVGGAWDIAAQCLMALQQPAAVRTLDCYGVGLMLKGALTDLSAIAGGYWESRVAFDFGISMFGVSFEAVEPIQTTKTTVNLEPGGITIPDIITT
jgi:hypothetical protein